MQAENYQPPKIHEPQIIPLQSEEHLKELISNFMGADCEGLDVALLFRIYEKIHEKGGMIHVLSIGTFGEIMKKVLEEQPMEEEKENMLGFV